MTHHTDRLAPRLKEEEARREAGLVLRQDLLALRRVPRYRCPRNVVAGAEFDRGFGHVSTTTWGFSPLISVSSEASAGGVRLSSLGPSGPLEASHALPQRPGEQCRSLRDSGRFRLVVP